MPADVIEVDFEARSRERMPLPERADALGVEFERIAAGIEETTQRAIRRYEWVDRQWTLERRALNRLARELRRERARNFPFSDEQVCAALRAEYSGEPVAATAIVRRLYGGRESTHSARVRAGLALSRLRAAGRVQGVRCRKNVPYAAYHWVPREAHNAR